MTDTSPYDYPWYESWGDNWGPSNWDTINLLHQAVYAAAWVIELENAFSIIPKLDFRKGFQNIFNVVFFSFTISSFYYSILMTGNVFNWNPDIVWSVVLILYPIEFCLFLFAVCLRFRATLDPQNQNRWVGYAPFSVLLCGLVLFLYIVSEIVKLDGSGSWVYPACNGSVIVAFCCVFLMSCRFVYVIVNRFDTEGTVASKLRILFRHPSFYLLLAELCFAIVTFSLFMLYDTPYVSLGSTLSDLMEPMSHTSFLFLCNWMTRDLKKLPTSTSALVISTSSKGLSPSSQHSIF